MKKTVHPFALAALLTPSLLFASTVEVTFDAALTNETGWVYSDIATNKDGNIYFKLSSSVQSPTFSFNITSVEITLSCTSTEPSRILQIIPSSGEATNAASVAKASTKETQIFEFDKADTARSFSIRLTGSDNTGNWYIYSAVISGVPIIDAPTNLQADNIRGTRCDLSWTNPANAVSNRVDVLEVTRIAGSSSVERKYDFNEFSNDGNTSQQTDRIVSAYPDLSGFMLCLPTNTTGQIQLSTRDDKGVLVIREFESYEGLRLELVARHYDHTKEAKTMSIGYVLDGATNDFASVVLASEFSPSSIPLSEVPAGAQLILNNSGNKQFHRVIIDEISFVRNFAVSTNLVKTAFVTDSTTYSVRGLCPRTEYVARITAFDADGNESSPSEPLAVTTNGEAIPFSIHIK